MTAPFSATLFGMPPAPALAADTTLSTGRRLSAVLPEEARLRPLGCVSPPWKVPARWHLASGISGGHLQPWIHTAIARADEEAVEALLVAGPAVAAVAHQGLSALRAAVLGALVAPENRRAVALKIARRLLSGADGFQLSNEGPSLLAATARDPELRLLLLEAGAHPIDSDGLNVSLWGALYAGDAEAAEFWESWGWSWPRGRSKVNPWAAVLPHLPGISQADVPEGRVFLRDQPWPSWCPRPPLPQRRLPADAVERWARQLADPANGPARWQRPLNPTALGHPQTQNPRDVDSPLMRACRCGTARTVTALLDLKPIRTFPEGADPFLVWLARGPHCLVPRDDPAAWLNAVHRLEGGKPMPSKKTQRIPRAPLEHTHRFAALLRGPCSDPDAAIRAWGWQQVGTWKTGSIADPGAAAVFLDAVLAQVLDRGPPPGWPAEGSHVPSEAAINPWIELCGWPPLQTLWRTPADADRGDQGWLTPRALLRARAEGRVDQAAFEAVPVPWREWLLRTGGISLRVLVQPARAKEPARPAFAVDTLSGLLEQAEFVDGATETGDNLAEAAKAALLAQRLFDDWCRSENDRRVGRVDVLRRILFFGNRELNAAAEQMLANELPNRTPTDLGLRDFYEAIEKPQELSLHRWPSSLKESWHALIHEDLLRKSLGETGASRRARHRL